MYFMRPPCRVESAGGKLFSACKGLKKGLSTHFLVSPFKLVMGTSALFEAVNFASQTALWKCSCSNEVIAGCNVNSQATVND